MKALPQFIKPYFWDVDFAKLDYKKYSRFVLGRILEYGGKRAISWMQRNFTKGDIPGVLSRLRAVSPKSANFWALIYGIDRKKILCLQKHYLQMRKRHWPY